MSERYHEGSRRLQDRNDTRRLADRLEQVTVHAKFDDEDKAAAEALRPSIVAPAQRSPRAKARSRSIRVIAIACAAPWRPSTGGRPNIAIAPIVVRRNAPVSPVQPVWPVQPVSPVGPVQPV